MMNKIGEEALLSTTLILAEEKITLIYQAILKRLLLTIQNMIVRTIRYNLIFTF